MPTTSLTRTLRVENETGLSGSEAIVEELNENLDQEISASTEEEVSIGGFKAAQLQTLSLLCNHAVNAQFLGVRYNILATVQAARTITFSGDVSDIIEAGDLVRLEGTAGQNGVYSVLTAAGASPTTITLTTGHEDLTDTGAVGTFAKVMSRQLYHTAYTAATVTAATGVITYTGDISDVFAAGDFLLIDNSTGNDGIFVIDSVTTDGPPVTTTTITANGGALPDNTNDGDFAKIRSFIKLAINIPFLWSIEGGTNNPFEVSAAFTTLRGDVDVLMVDNTGTASLASFDGRIGKNSIL